MEPASLRDVLSEFSVENLPQDADDGVLEAVLFFAERLKRVRFPEGATDTFLVDDARVRVRVIVARAPDVGTGLADAIEQAALRAERCEEPLVALAVDAREAGLREYELEHALWGRVTLFDYPHRPTMPSQPLVHEARERGWGSVLKEHNLLPGRGIVVQDGDHGLLLTEDATRRFCGVLLIPAGTPPAFSPNPFCPAIADDPEFRFWLKWGSGTSEASQWVTMLDERENRNP